MPFRMCVAADCVPLRFAVGSRLEVLLIRRGNDPFKGMWALPGGFVEEDEDLRDAAARELCEETSLTPVVLDEVGAWGAPGRDPRGRTVSDVFLAIIGPGAPAALAGDDAAGVAWHPADDLPPTAFDHGEILAAALERLRARCRHAHLALAFLGREFSLDELRELLSAVEGVEPARRTLRRVMESALLVPCGEMRKGDPSQMGFRFEGDDYLAPLERE